MAYFLLVGEGEEILVKNEKTNTHYGMIDGTKLKHGMKIKMKNKTFYVTKPALPDMIKKCRRMPQIVMFKDASQILAVTGLTNGWRCLDAGGGSGFLSVFIGYYVQPDGKVFCYERNKEFAENIKKNIEICGLGKIVEVKPKTVFGFRERKLNIVTLDMIDAEKLMPEVYKALVPGGWLCVYSPHIEQQKKVIESAGKLVHIKTIENIQREWQVSDYTHPKPSGIMHTGFMSFFRKYNFR